MRVIETTVYKYGELSPEAQERAREKFNYAEQYAWSDEALASIAKLAGHFGGRMVDYNVDWLEPGRSSFEFSMPDDMTKREIASRLRDLGTYNKRTGKGHGDCKLTGVCSDEACIDGFRASYREGTRDLDAMMHTAGEYLLQSCREDYEYQLSAEGFAETCEANGYEFDDSGDMV